MTLQRGPFRLIPDCFKQAHAHFKSTAAKEKIGASFAACEYAPILMPETRLPSWRGSGDLKKMWYTVPFSTMAQAMPRTGKVSTERQNLRKAATPFRRLAGARGSVSNSHKLLNASRLRWRRGSPGRGGHWRRQTHLHLSKVSIYLPIYLSTCALIFEFSTVYSIYPSTILSMRTDLRLCHLAIDLSMYFLSC